MKSAGLSKILKATLLCSVTIVNTMAAPKCSNELDSYFSSLPTWLSENQASFGLDKSCVSLSMNAFGGWAQALGHDDSGKEGVFIYCSEETSSKSSLPQCQTKAYLNTSLNTYNGITDCLDINIKDLYPIIAAESGFYHNSLSMIEADFGFGQVTDPAISDVNDNWYRFLDQMKESSKQSCQNIIKFIEQRDLQPVDSDFRCELTAAPKNPLLNALYTGIHYKIITGYMEAYSQRNNFQARVENFLGKDFTLGRFEKIKSNLIILSYNMGHIGATTALEEFLLEKESRKQVLTKEKSLLQRELAKINFRLMGGPGAKLEDLKNERLAELSKINIQIKNETGFHVFNGDDTSGSFGEYLTKRNLSSYLKILARRVKYIGLKDKQGLCPTKDFLILN